MQFYLGLLNNNLFVGDWLNHDLLSGDKLYVSLNLIVNWELLLIDQVLGELVQKELVVGGGSLEGGGWDRESVVGVWKVVPVLQEYIIDQGLESENIFGLSVDVGGESVLGVEELNNGVNVLVEEDGIDKVLLVGGQLPETLEVDGADKTLEAWVLDVLAEQRDAQVFPEQTGSVQFLEGKHTVGINDIVVDAAEDLFLLNWNDGGVNQVILSDNDVLLQLLLQQQIIANLDHWRVQQGFLLVDQTKGLKVQAASSYGGDKSHKDLEKMTKVKQ